MTYRWIILTGGTLGFILGSWLGNNRGAAQGPRTIILHSHTPSFFVGLVLGFINPWLTRAVSSWTAFLPGWLNFFLWTTLLGFLSGLPMGYRLGRAFMINLNYNRTPNVRHTAPSTGPATVGVIIGLAVFVFLAYRL